MYSCNKGLECESCTHTTNPLLAGINVNDREGLNDERIVIDYKKGDLLYKEGMLPYGLLCLNLGQVMVTKKDQYGNLIIINLQKGVSFIGIADFISGGPYQSDCHALSDCKVCIIKKENVNILMSENKFFVKNVLSEISDQFHQANNRMLALTKKYMPARLADALCLLYDIFGTKEDELTLNVYLKRKELASLSNMNESNVIRHLSTFKEEGHIDLIKKDILIKDIEKLQSLSLKI